MDYEVQPLPDDLRQRAVAHLRTELGEGFFAGLREAHARDPAKWWADGGWHFHQGMAIRNLLRKAIRDAELPANTGGDCGNWDDYYVEVLEEAAGLR